jgi:hypothetical protein
MIEERKSSPQQSLQGTRRVLLLPFLAASLLASLAATFHSTQIDQLYDEPTQQQNPWRSRRTSTSTSKFQSHYLVVHPEFRENPIFHRNEFTFDTFRVAGMELASYGLDGGERPQPAEAERNTKPPFELFEDFDLSSQLVGNETWVDLIGYRRDAQFPSLSFYVDKIARKRWLPTTSMDGLQPFVLKYGEELVGDGSDHSSREEEQRKALLNLLPLGKDYAAKPTHLSCAGGVWLTKTVGNATFIGNGKKPMKENPDFSIDLIAQDLAKQLQKVQKSCGRRVMESLALQNVKPGIVVEERFTSWDGQDDRGGMEFKVFTIWGKMWLAVQRPGMDGAVAILHRNGTNLQWEGKSDPLPEWIDWPKIVEIAEKSGAHKDMFRTDIFVGVPSSGNGPFSSETMSRDERLKAVRYVISENEIHPTEYFHVKGTQPIFDEGGRLWLAGYAKGNYRVVPNTEVPPDFVKHGMLPEH